MSEYRLILEVLEEIKELLTIQNKQRFAEQYLTTAEVCDLLDVSKRTVQKYRDGGDLPWTRFGKRIYFRLSDLEAVLEKGLQTGKPKKPARKLKPSAKRALMKGSWTLRP